MGPSTKINIRAQREKLKGDSTSKRRNICTRLKNSGKGGIQKKSWHGGGGLNKHTGRI